MSVSVLSRPIVSGCNWNAAGNPIVYRMRRVDDTISQINNNGGFIQLQFTGSDHTADYVTGDTVRLLDILDETIYQDGEITASIFSGGDTLITLDLTYSLAIAGTYDIVNNMSRRAGWKLVVDVFDDEDDESILDGFTLSFSPNQAGILIVDVSSILKSVLSAEWNKPTSTNEIEPETSIRFYIKYEEFYNGALQGLESDSTNPIHAVFAAMQIGAANGGNMLPYFLEEDDTTKKFLQRFQPSESFKKMVMWRDWPFTVSWICPDELDFGGDVYVHYKQYDAAGVMGAEGQESLGLFADIRREVNRIDLFALDGFPFNDQTKRLTIQLKLGPDFDPEDYISEILDIELRDTCEFNADFEGLLPEKNPIHLFWKNSVGGDAWWNFEKVHEYSFTYSDGKKAKRIVLFATGLHPVQWDALNDLNTIGEVYRTNIVELTSAITSTSKRIGQQVYMVSQDGDTKTGVIVIPATDTQKSRWQRNTISIEIELPEIFGME